MKYHMVESENNKIAFSASNGAIISLKRDSTELLNAADELFTVHLRSDDAVRKVIHGSEFASFSFDGKTFSYSGHPEYAGLQVKIELRTENGFFYFRPFVWDIPARMRLELVDVPQLITDGTGHVLTPYSEGGVDSNPLNGFPYFQPDSQEYYVDNYPGMCQMQFLAYYSDDGGIYFAAHDLTHAPKRILYYANEARKLRLSLETFCGTDEIDSYTSPFEYVLGTFSGAWMDAAEIYRDWIKKASQIKRRKDLPDWLDDSPVIIIYPVCGNGSISSEPNDYLPYLNALPHIKAIAEETGSRVMALLMRWDQYGAWLPPYIWPPRGGENALAEFRDALHEQGHLLGLYGSGTSWTQKSMTSDYSGEAEFEGKKLDKVMTCRPDGKTDYYVMGGIRDGYHLCLTEEWSKDTLKKQVAAIAKAGVDFLQFFDQNLGGTSFLCYAKDHAHPSLPGAWQTDSMYSLIKEMNDEIKALGSKMIMGTECAAAEPYINELPFSDLRPTFVWSRALPVPLYQFVFHEYVNNFMGNQVFASQCIDCETNSKNLLYRIAYAFNAGDLLSVTLRNNGIIDWGAASDWNSVQPDQKSATTLICNLNNVRKKYPEFLRHGKMLKPLIKIEGGKYTLHVAGNKYFTKRDELMDSFFHSSWEAPNGKKVQIITNFLLKTQRVFCTPPSDNLYIIDEKKRNSPFEIEIPPMSARILHIQ